MHLNEEAQADAGHPFQHKHSAQLPTRSSQSTNLNSHIE